ncbi:MAG: histidinol dehydrogenase, partial [Lachnospiraceae bacterium]|nr:histidinol dehydrogenase [Lachnospiraceae bacterium]
MNKLILDENNIKDVLDELIKRSPNHYGEFENIVNTIVNDIRTNKDRSVFEYTKKFDKFDLNADNIRVTKE